MGEKPFYGLESALVDAAELKHSGQFLAALHRLREAVLERFSATGAGTPIKPTPIDLLAIENLADLAVLFNQSDAANDLLESIGLWYERAGNRYFADYTAVKRAHLALDCGRLFDGYQILRGIQSSIGNPEEIVFSDQGLKLWEDQLDWPRAEPIDRVILFSRLYLEMGRILTGFGQYREAVVALKRGLAHTARAETGIVADVIMHLRVARATALLEQGEMAEARSRLAELADDLSDRQRPGLYIRHLELSGKLALLCGQFGQALEQFRQALETCTSFGFDQAAVTASLNLSHTLIYLNQTSVAREILAVTGARAEKLGDLANAIRARFLLRIAQARGHSLAGAVSIAPSVSEVWGVINDAPPDQEENAQVDPFDLPQSDSYLSFFDDRALGFHWLLGRRDFTGAAAYLSEITQIFELSDSPLIQLRLRIFSAMLAYYQDHLRQAGLKFEALRNELRSRKWGDLKPELWQALRFLSWCWARLGGHDGRARQELEEETQRAMAEMTCSLAPVDRAIFLLNKWTEDEEYLAAEIHLLAALKARLESGSWTLQPQRRWRMMKRLHRLSLHIDRYKDVVARGIVNRGSSAPKEAKPISLLRRLWSHPRDRATLAFLVLPDQVFILRAGWLSLDFGVSPITRLQIRDLVRRWHELIRKLLENSRGLGALQDEAKEKMEIHELSQQGQLIATHLSKALQIPAFLASLPKEIRSLTIVPDDSLHGFPFAAITDEGKHLIERYSISLAFESNSRAVSNERAEIAEALVVGVAQGSSPGVAQIGDLIQPLAGAPLEINQVADWLDQHQFKVCRLDDSAPEFEPAEKATILDRLPRADLFHIACHGIFKADAPDQSGLVLIPQPDAAEILSLRELSDLNLTGLRHATLSSCWSADHFILPGRWIISLPETLWRAGTQSVLGCLWVVNDEIAVAFMRRFYEHLKTCPRDESLKLTQLECLQRRLPDCKLKDQSNLYYWAGYNLYGDYGRLKL